MVVTMAFHFILDSSSFGFFFCSLECVLLFGRFSTKQEKYPTVATLETQSELKFTVLFLATFANKVGFLVLLHLSHDIHIRHLHKYIMQQSADIKGNDKEKI